ncbi:MAG: exosortase/archaeosortase family protein [Candidatus Nanoarchaeia archaeon]|nr:exosortase/archaeosortase family protein [Candidatus Nanoarchaeia archaeon]
MNYLKKIDKILLKNKKILVYLIRFLILSLPIILIINLNFYFLQNIYAFINQILLKLFGITTVFFDSFSSNGISPSLYFNEKIVKIDSACTGIRSFYLLFAMIFAFKARFKKKIKYLIIGALAIFFVNVIRIFVSSLLFFNGYLGFDNIIWAMSLNITVFIIIYFFIKKK